MAADVAGAAGDQDAAHRLPSDREVGEAVRLRSAAGCRCCGRRRSTGAFISFFIRAKSGSRNSFHSVTSASASAPDQRLVALAGVGDARCRRCCLADVASPRGRRPGPWRPASSSASMIVIAGASRMSSVRGLNARPQTRDGLALQRAEVALHLGRRSSCFCARVDLLDRLEDLEVVALVLRELEDRLDVLGEAAAAVADAREQERGADALVGGHRPPHLVDVGAVQLAHAARSRS